MNSTSKKEPRPIGDLIKIALQQNPVKGKNPNSD
jgi:hypothetical protein